MIASFFNLDVSKHLRFPAPGGRAVALSGAVVLACVSMLSGCKGAFDEKAAAQWRQARGSATIATMPAMVRIGRNTHYDPSAATTTAEWVNQQKLGSAAARTEQIPILGSWHTDQSRMFRESAASIGEYRKSNPIDADYLLMVECLFFATEAGQRGKLIGVHLYLVDREGRFADGILLNSHYPLFNERSPATPAECVDLALTAWKREMR